MNRAGEIIVRGGYRDLSHPDITRIWIERAEVGEIESGLSRNRGSGFQRISKGWRNIFLILPRKTENPNRIISKTRKIEPYQSRVDFARCPNIDNIGMDTYTFSQLYETRKIRLLFSLFFSLPSEYLNFKKIYSEFHKWKTIVSGSWILGSKFDRATTKFLRGF